MSYKIHITRSAERDLNRAVDHIDLILKNPSAADRLLDLTEEAISGLAVFPKKYPLVYDRVLASWGIRSVLVKNYLAFYVVDEKTKTIHIVRFLYAKSNWAAILKADLPHS